MREKQVHQLLQDISECRVLVVGDLMIDEYCRGHIERISPEAPVPILNIVARDATLGGAGNVVSNLRSLNVAVMAVGVLGDDETGEHILNGLRALGVSGDGLVREAERVSTRKVRYVTMEHGQQVFRADEETPREVNGKVEDKIISQVREKAASAEVILCSDYLKGVLTARVLEAIFEIGRDRKVPVIVAPKDSQARKYKGASILMPNVKEFSRLVETSADGDEWLTNSAEHLTKSLELEALLVTRGKQGMTLFEAQKNALRRVDIPTLARNVYDVTGAGDTALAVFSASIAARAGCEAAAHLANAAAGVAVGKRGTAIVKAEEILKHLSAQASDTQQTEETAAATLGIGQRE